MRTIVLHTAGLAFAGLFFLKTIVISNHWELLAVLALLSCVFCLNTMLMMMFVGMFNKEIKMDKPLFLRFCVCVGGDVKLAKCLGGHHCQILTQH